MVIHQQARVTTGQSRRAWQVHRRENDTPQQKIAWSMTIMDVANRYHDAQSYCELITQWARSVLAEMGPLLRT
jgi:hypothetical protein